MQVKNYKGKISDENINIIIDQVNKAEKYGWEDGKLIDKILIYNSS